MTSAEIFTVHLECFSKEPEAREVTLLPQGHTAQQTWARRGAARLTGLRSRRAGPGLGARQQAGPSVPPCGQTPECQAFPHGTFHPTGHPSASEAKGVCGYGDSSSGWPEFWGEPLAHP